MAQTYQTIIGLLERELRDFDAWPDAASKVQEQVDVIYRYGVEMTKELPLTRLKVEKSVALITAKIQSDTLLQADLPADLMAQRPDLGIENIEIESETGVSRLFAITEGVPFSTLRNSVTNFYQTGNFMLHIDPDHKKIFVPVFITKVFIWYAKNFAKPIVADIATAKIEFDDNAIEALVQAAAAHVLAVNVRDPQQAAVHSQLASGLNEQP